MQERRGEFGDAGPFITGSIGGRVDEVAPRGDAFDNGDQVADLGGFEGGSIDTGLVEGDGGIEQAAELEAATTGEHRTHLGGTLLLLIDPGKIRARFECQYPGLTQRRRSAAGDVIAETWPLQGSCAGFAQQRGDDRQ